MKWIDLSLGEKTFGDIKTARSMLDMFIESLPAAEKQLREHYQTQNWRQLYDQVHSFHGACCYASSPILLASVKQLNASLQIITQATTDYSDDIHKSIGDQVNLVIDHIQHTSAYYKDNFS